MLPHYKIIFSNPSCTICFSSTTLGQNLLLVVQTQFQQRMLNLYGTEITLLDATYDTTKYHLPLYQLAVSTNIGYLIVGSFFVANENKETLKEALGVLAAWNSTWSPKAWMTDFDRREIGAIEGIFPGIQKCLHNITNKL